MGERWTIRKMSVPEDLERVLGFQRETYELNFPGFVWSERFREEFEHALRRAHFSPNEGLFVAEDASGVVVGFVWVGVLAREFQRDRYVGLVRDIYVAPNHRGKGLGKVLLRHAERFAAERGATRMTLEVTASNTAAVQLYKKQGYHVQRLQMEKPLSPPARGDRR